MSAAELIKFNFTCLVAALVTALNNLVAGFRLALPLRATHAPFNASLGQFAILVTGLWLLSMAADLIDVGGDAVFSPWGVLAYATQSYFWVATLVAIVLLDRRPAEFLALGVAMASALVTVSCIWIITTDAWFALHADSYYENYRTLWRGFLIWEVIVFARIVVTTLRPARYKALVYAFAYAIAVYSMASFLPHRALFIEPIVFTEEDNIDIETTYYAQANLLEQSLYALSPQRPGIVDLYFVGFAAYAAQDVFKREIEQATVIFEQNYDAIGHTVKLINNLNTISSEPLATRHNLQRTVRDLSARLAREEDILVVFLSSHGAEDATIAVDMQNFGLNDLSARQLRAILDENDIKWRIIIVSACYSGSFIEALSSPYSLIITAAAADRASFGCAQGNEWTYFGQAYFEQALRQSHSFTATFELAREILAKRENAEGKEASKPQISIGSEIAAYLATHNL